MIVCPAHGGWLVEARHVLRRVHDALLEHAAIGPALVAVGLLRRLVDLDAGRHLAVLHQHVAEVQEEAFEVERRDPRVPAHAQPPDARLARERRDDVGLLAVDDDAGAHVDVAPLLLEPELEARPNPAAAGSGCSPS